MPNCNAILILCNTFFGGFPQIMTTFAPEKIIDMKRIIPIIITVLLLTASCGEKITQWQVASDEQMQLDTDHRLLFKLGTVIVGLLLILLFSFRQYRKRIDLLRYQRDENARLIANKTAKIQILEANGESHEKEIAQLRQQIEDHRQQISNKILLGAKLFMRLQQKDSIVDFTADDRRLLVEYFTQLRPKRWKEWDTMYTNLTTSQIVFLIMQDDLRFDDETIASMLSVKVPSLRTIRSRIKRKER